MAENMKRRVAAARLAVAFVAAGAIAGASAWAQASPPPKAQSSAYDAFQKIKLTGKNIVDGSLYLQDFHRGQVASFKQFVKLDKAFNDFHKYAQRNYMTEKQADARYVKIDSTDYIKRSDLNGYIKMSEADQRYRQLSQPVVLGDGSVFTGDGMVGNQLIGLLDVPGFLKVEGVSQKVRITNMSSEDMQHSACTDAQGSTIPPGTLKPGSFIECDAGGRSGFTQTMQLFTGGVKPAVATLNFTSMAVSGGAQDTVQILVGL